MKSRVEERQHEQQDVPESDTVETPNSPHPAVRLRGWTTPAWADRGPFTIDNLEGDLIVVHGYPGSGKSTLAANLLGVLSGYEIDADPALGTMLRLETVDGVWLVERSPAPASLLVAAPLENEDIDPDLALDALLGKSGPLTELRFWTWGVTDAVTDSLLPFITPGVPGQTVTLSPVLASFLAEATKTLQTADAELASTRIQLERYRPVPSTADLDSAEERLSRLREEATSLPRVSAEALAAAQNATALAATVVEAPAPPRWRVLLAKIQPVALLLTAGLVATAIGLLFAQISTPGVIAAGFGMLAAAIAAVSPPKELRAERLARDLERRIAQCNAEATRRMEKLESLERNVNAIAATLRLPELPSAQAIERREQDVAAYRDARIQADALATQLVEIESRQKAAALRHREVTARAALVDYANGAAGPAIAALTDQLLAFGSRGSLQALRVEIGPDQKRRPVLQLADGSWAPFAQHSDSEQRLADLCLRSAVAVSAIPVVAARMPLVIDDIELNPGEPIDQGVASVLSWATARLTVIALTGSESTAMVLAGQSQACVALLPAGRPNW